MNDPFKNFKPLNAKATKKSSQKQTNSFVESIRDIGSSTVGSLKTDVAKGKASSIYEQLLQSSQTGQVPEDNSNADLEAWVKEREDAAASEARQKERSFQQHKSQESKVLFSFADEKLKKEISEVRQELALLVKSMGKVEKEIEKAVMQEVVEPGTYHLNFFRRLKSWIKVMRKSMEDASLWMDMANSRKSRGNYWTTAKTHGTKFSQSAEHSLTRAAG